MGDVVAFGNEATPQFGLGDEGLRYGNNLLFMFFALLLFWQFPLSMSLPM